MNLKFHLFKSRRILIWICLDSEKGVAFINGYNLGRFWNIGPTLSLYIPRGMMVCGEKYDYYFLKQRDITKKL